MTGEVIDLKVEPAIVILQNGQVAIVILLNVVHLPSKYLFIPVAWTVLSLGQRSHFGHGKLKYITSQSADEKILSAWP